MKVKRRRYIIDTKLQLRFTLFFVLVSLVGNTLAIAVFNTLAMKQLDTLIWSTHISIASTDELIRPVFISVNLINFFFVIIMLLLTGALMLKKTSGPLYRMSHDIRKVAGGDLSSRIVLRQKDEFRDVAHELNSMTEELNRKFTAVRDKFYGLSGPVERLVKRAGGKEDVIENCNELLKGIDGIETEINSLEL